MRQELFKSRYHGRGIDGHKTVKILNRRFHCLERDFKLGDNAVRPDGREVFRTEPIIRP